MSGRRSARKPPPAAGASNLLRNSESVSQSRSQRTGRIHAHRIVTVGTNDRLPEELGSLALAHRMPQVSVPDRERGRQKTERLRVSDREHPANDPSIPDAGFGRLASTHAYVTGNDPNDAYVPSNSEFQKGWIQHLTNRWGTAAQGGVKYYIMDNEPSIWQGTHRDVHPKGASQDEFLARFIDYASMVKSVDPSAMIVGPEEWSWPGYVLSGLDQQNGNTNDRDAHGGQYYLPWLLSQFAYGIGVWLAGSGSSSSLAGIATGVRIGG